ncbi:armadillo-type protein [Suillus paluster]|uniref:armadillo-type protein n=1 Tax=Suillus paluster TaxID=48578 RepID=UPI001B85B378|nr:armadillo-type protein [Suillus paluster]KAG1750350.1 armadillo-type protein [Suillus paluster]
MGKELVKTLKTLMKGRDFFVTPAAVAALCRICSNGQLRTEAIQCGVLATLIKLFKSDDHGLSGGPRGLTELAEFEDVRDELTKGSHIDTLVKFSKSRKVERSKEATEELTRLSEHDTLREQIIDRGGVESIVDNLAKPDHALFAAHALLTLMKHDDAKARIMNTEVDLHLLQMVEKRIFDGTIRREGMVILEEIFENDDLRSMMLAPRHQLSLDNNGSWNFPGTGAPWQRLPKKLANCILEKVIHGSPTTVQQYQGNVIGILHKLLENTRLDSVQKSAVRYLRVIANHKDALSSMVGVGIVKALVWCIKDVDIRIVNDVLKKIADHPELRSEIIKTDKILAEMLSSHYPAEILRVTAALESLSSCEDIRRKVQSMRVYRQLEKDALHYLDPHHHPHDRDQHTLASNAIKSMIKTFDEENHRVANL